MKDKDLNIVIILRMLAFLSIVLLFMFITLKACNIKTYIPKNAKKYYPMVLKEVKTEMPNFKYPWYFGGLIEHESCIRICGKSKWVKRCWSPTSELKTKREQGVGFGQITRAWSKTGRLRFDTLRDLKRLYPNKLKGLNWNNIKQKPRLQARALILLWRRNFLYFSKDIPLIDRIWFSDSAYNGGLGWVRIDRKICKLRPNCNPDKWFGNVEKIKDKRARRKLYGNRTAWDINRHHVRDVKARMNKYKKFTFEICDGMRR